MRKICSLIGIVLLAVLVLGFLLLKHMASKPAAPEDYQKTTQTGGQIEAAYMANGPYEVSVHEENVLQVFEKFTVYYPSALETDERPYPVIVLCNGSGTPLSRYPAVAKHYASWGFLVIGTEERFSWNAFGAEMSLRYLERMNENQEMGEGLFYQKVDLHHVGVVGHSQGGVGVLNAVTNTPHKDVYRTAVSLSPTNKELAHSLFWDYDASLIQIPVMFVSGEGGGDDWVVTGEQLRSIYEDVPSDKIMARRLQTDHGEVLYSIDGYVTAWLMWQLQGDAEAGKAFTGETPEIMTNPLYQDQEIHFVER